MGLHGFIYLKIYGLQQVTLKIYDLQGREVAVVVDKKLPAGEHMVRFDASHLPDGIYLVQLQTGDDFVTMKVMVKR